MNHQSASHPFNRYDKALFAVLFLVLIGLATLQLSHADSTSRISAAQATRIEQGRHLVEQVAMCVDCHTPKMSNDLLDTTKLLMRAEISTVPLEPIADWVGYAPAIAGLPNYSVDEVVEVLTTGTIGNTYLRPPMPVYRMNEEDARAIALYLQALGPGQEEQK